MRFLDCIRFNYIVLLFSFFLPINEKLSTVLIFVCLLALFRELYTGRIRPVWQKQLLILPALFLVYAISIFIFSKDYDFKWFENKASLLAFPLLFLGAASINFKKVTRFYIYGCVTAYLLCLGNAIYKSISFSNGQLKFSPLLNDARGFLEAIVYEGNEFFAEHFSVLMQTAYFGFYLTLAASLLLIYNTALFKRNTVIIFGILVLAGIIQTMSLAAFGGIIIAMFIISIHLIRKKKARFAIYGLLTSLILLSYFIQPRFKGVIQDISKNELELDSGERYGVMLRFLSWDASWTIIREHPIFGVGLANAQNELIKIYKEKNYVYPLKQKLNSHNQFLQLLIECGIIGLVLIMAIFYFLFQKAARVSFFERVFIRTFTIVLLFNFIFESYFNRYIGLSIVCFFYGLCITLKEEKRPHEIKG